ncbi:MAG: hypothetical protein M1840_002031 [Geoglossum simile]|nr:MAG: hypothetical protein M1840_002031 [Geoglossum simile]
MVIAAMTPDAEDRRWDLIYELESQSQGSRPDGQLNGVLVGQSERQPILGIEFKPPGIVSSCFSKGKDGNWKLKLYGARGRARDDIAYEFSAYTAARSLQGTVLPQCHGLFSLTPSSSPMATTTDGTEGLFLVEEFLVGYSDVFELCRKTPEAFLDAWTEVLAAATMALDMLHDCGIMHGDLRDENLMIQLRPGRMNVKIVDLGGCWISTRPDAQLTNPQRSTEYAILFWMLMGTKDDAEGAVHDHQGSWSDSQDSGCDRSSPGPQVVAAQ